MVQPVTVGLDIANNVFHASGVDAQGEKVFSRKLRRPQVEAFFAKLEPCLVGIKACARAARSWKGLEVKSCGKRSTTGDRQNPFIPERLERVLLIGS